MKIRSAQSINDESISSFSDYKKEISSHRETINQIAIASNHQLRVGETMESKISHKQPERSNTNEMKEVIQEKNSLLIRQSRRIKLLEEKMTDWRKKYFKIKYAGVSYEKNLCLTRHAITAT